jgi:predicted phage terminase large subunit-like protein
VKTRWSFHTGSVDSGHLAADKIMRLHAQTAAMENGFVVLPEAAPWLADPLAELAAFPMGRHDE